MVFDDKGLTRSVKDDLSASRIVGSTGSTTTPTILSKFAESYSELEAYKHGGESVKVDGRTLSIAAVTAAARCSVYVTLNDSPHIQERVAKSRSVIANKVESGASVYGLSTGFGGSADTRTNEPLLLGKALLQHQQAGKSSVSYRLWFLTFLLKGVLPTYTDRPDILPLLDPGSSLSMPESWVRGAMLIRANSLIRGHSGVRWELIEKINELLNAHITPLVPLRGSISASGDLSPLSYIAGALVGNPSIHVFDGPQTFGARNIRPSCDALTDHHIEPLTLASKEPLGILNGTAFSASVAALALHDALQLAMLSQVCTAMGVEALLGSRGSFDPFIHVVARPHHGQVECARNIWNLLEGSKLAQSHEEEVTLEEDKYSLRQDRYPLRTSPQFLGPQFEDLLSAFSAVTQECNSTTDNPLIDSSTGIIHHGGNFQAMAVTNAMEKTRVALHHVGKLLFAQCAELTNPAMNNGLPPSLAASNPSLDYHCKGADIATAAYVAELGYLANPVSTHIQSAEMHNQAINSLALISARATINSLQVLSLLVASYLYILCQALDLRAMRLDFNASLEVIVTEELNSCFEHALSKSSADILASQLLKTMSVAFDKTTTMDAADQMNALAASSTTVLFDFLSSHTSVDASIFSAISTFRTNVSVRSYKMLDQLRGSYLSGERGSVPARVHLGKTRSIYEFIRSTLGIKMHGAENHFKFTAEPGENNTIGQQISVIHEAIRDGRFQKVLVEVFT